MREILFKAKRVDNEEWVEGYYFKQLIVKGSPIQKHYIIVAAPPKRGKFYKVIFNEIDPSTLCQCTGLQDKDKTLIYENDIVRTGNGECGVIKFGKYGDMKTDYGFYIEWSKTHPYFRKDICYWQRYIRVIGQYADNSELLKGGAK